MKKILITGVLGQVGYELKRTLAPFGEIIAIDKDELDLTNQDEIRRFIRKIAPDIIVNPAAYTAVEKAEEDVKTCMLINQEAVKVIAEEAKAINALLIHYSTDYVFDGSKEIFSEEDTPSPLNVYGLSKLEGENAIREVGGRFLIFRTSWVYGSRGQNFLLTMLKLAKQHTTLNIVKDQIGAPTWSRLIAEVTALVIARVPFLENNPGFYGTYNLTNRGQTSWADFAHEIFSISQKNHPESKQPTIVGIMSDEYPVKATRPKQSLLLHDKLEKTFGIKMPDWKSSLKLCMEEL